MIILDTNVLSALMLSRPEPQVVAWLDDLPADSIWTSAVTVFEVRFGLEIVADSAKRRRLTEAFEALLTEDLGGRVLDLDRLAAERAAVLAAELRRAGHGLEVRDAMICGIALARRATVATRNVRHFEGTGVAIVNPWDL